MRDEIKQQLIDNADKFWENMGKLPPKQFCEVYLKMLPYGFSRVPEEHPVSDDVRQRLVLEETTRKATLIGAGLPQAEEEDFEEEE